MAVRHRIFESVSKSWDDLAKEAEDFAASVGRDKLINISMAASGATWKGLIVVWYWE